MIHRNFISPSLPPLPGFPSLAICSNAARGCSRVLEVIQQRGLAQESFGFAPFPVSRAPSDPVCESANHYSRAFFRRPWRLGLYSLYTSFQTVKLAVSQPPRPWQTSKDA